MLKPIDLDMTQLSDDEVSQRLADMQTAKEKEAEEARHRLKKLYSFRFVGGMI